MRGLFAAALALTSALAQTFSGRGFMESDSTFYPQTAVNDSSHAVSEMHLRYEASWQPRSWIKLAGALDARTDTHRQTERAWRMDFDDRSALRPPLSARRFSLVLARGGLTLEAGRQFIRWGKTDILNPTDRFAPKDFVNVVSTDFLGVNAVRLTYERGGDTIDLVWQPWFTPSRTPLLNQRWTAAPADAAAISIRDNGARYPGRSQFGVRWNHIARGYEYSLCYFDGFNHLPLFAAERGQPALTVAVQRYYPQLRLVGGDGAFPTRWVTIKGEAAYFATTRQQSDEYLLYVVQFERQQGEWSWVGGYAGETITKAAGKPLQFSPEQGLARAILGRASYRIGPSQDAAIEGAVRQNGDGLWLRFEFSQAWGRHWRATLQWVLIRGDASDFIGQYRRNSYAQVRIRYSF